MPAWWPSSPAGLAALQKRLAGETPPPSSWPPGRRGSPWIAAVFVASARGLTGAGAMGDPAWAAAVALQGRQMLASAVVRDVFTAAYVPGFLALREGELLERAVRALGLQPDVLLVNATGRDHPHRAGLALHLGAALDLPTIGVTDRPLLASGTDPEPRLGARAELRLDGELVGYRVRAGPARPVAVHAGWRMTPERAADIVTELLQRSRTPEPLRQARRLARTARSRERSC